MPHLVPRLRATRSVPRHLISGLAVALVAALLCWAPVPPAAAHGELLYSDPSEGGVLQALPSRAFLTFSDAISEVREIAVVGPEGSVTNGAPSSVGPEVRQTLGAGADGTYTMEYFVVSADGHDVRGEVIFEVGNVSGAAADGTSDTEASAARDEGGPERGRAAILPAGLVVVGAVVALVLLRRRRVGTDNG